MTQITKNMKPSFSEIAYRIQTVFPEATIEHISMLADSIIRYRDNLPKITRKKPFKAKDVITILKHN